MNCPSCQTDNPSAVKFCVECGCEITAAKLKEPQPNDGKGTGEFSQTETGILHSPLRRGGALKRFFACIGRGTFAPFAGLFRLTAWWIRSNSAKPTTQIILWSGAALLLAAAFTQSLSSSDGRNLLIGTVACAACALLLRNWTARSAFRCLVVLWCSASLALLQLGLTKHTERTQDYKERLAQHEGYLHEPQMMDNKDLTTGISGAVIAVVSMIVLRRYLFGRSKH